MATAIYTEGEYLANNPTWHEEDSPVKARWIDALLRKHDLRPNTIAEIGCGAGQILVELSARRPEASFTGFEISPQAFAICSKKSAPNLTFHLEDLTSSVRAPFDLLLVIDIFEHVPDYMGFIQSLRGKAELKVFNIPLDLSAQGVLRGKALTGVRKKLGHLHYFTKDTALATLSDTGYEVLDWAYMRGTQELPGRRLKTRMANLPRKVLQAFSEDLAARALGGYSLMVLAR